MVKSADPAACVDPTGENCPAAATVRSALADDWPEKVEEAADVIDTGTAADEAAPNVANEVDVTLNDAVVNAIADAAREDIAETDRYSDCVEFDAPANAAAEITLNGCDIVALDAAFKTAAAITDRFCPDKDADANVPVAEETMLYVSLVVPADSVNAEADTHHCAVDEIDQVGVCDPLPASSDRTAICEVLVDSTSCRSVPQLGVEVLFAAIPKTAI